MAEYDKLIAYLDLGDLLPPTELGGDLPNTLVVIALHEVDVLAPDLAPVKEGVFTAAATEISKKIQVIVFCNRVVQTSQDSHHPWLIRSQRADHSSG